MSGVLKVRSVIHGKHTSSLLCLFFVYYFLQYIKYIEKEYKIAAFVFVTVFIQYSSSVILWTELVMKFFKDSPNVNAFETFIASPIQRSFFSGTR